MISDSPGPDEIRRLRGARSRAAFARDIGVTPLTVYRWELPDGADEARRPRGAVRARLLALASPPADPPAPAPQLDDAAAAEVTLVAPALEHIARGDGRKAETELLALLARGRLTTPAGRGLAAVGLAQIQVAMRSDASGALQALLPALADADAGRLPADIEARVHAVAAVVFAWSDGRLFDPGRVQAHAERALERGGSEPPPGVRFFAFMAHVAAGFTVGDQEMLLRTFAGGSSAFADGDALGAYWQSFAQEGRALHAMATGRPTVAAQRYEELAARAEAE